ncbi:MAG: hypothetical protein WCO98_07230 [bacterium]
MPNIITEKFESVIFTRSSGKPLYLVLHRSPDATEGNTWQLLRGIIPTGLSSLQSALNSLTTHTGFNPMYVWAPNYIHSEYDAITDSISHLPVFAIEVAQQRPVLSADFSDSRWVTAEQAIELLRLTGQRSALKAINDDIVTNSDRGIPYQLKING